MNSLGDWNEDYLRDEIVPADESDSLEKKASAKFALTVKGQPDSETKQELAKQVSAFANSGRGFVVYGITDDKKLDIGVPIRIGTQSTKDWVEAIIPKLVAPPVTQCTAKIVQISGSHSADRGVLAISIPLSERRPHWIEGPSETAYLRAGAHSVPMRMQTTLDLAHRSSASTAEILSLNPGSAQPEGMSSAYEFNPSVRLVSGPICEKWGLDLQLLPGTGKLRVSPDSGVRHTSEHHVYVIGNEPLFPRRETKVFNIPGTVAVLTQMIRKFELVATLYAGAAQAVTKGFTFPDLSLHPLPDEQ